VTASAFADRLLGYPHNLIVTHDSQVITANVTNIRACYQKALAGGAADLRGKVIVHFEIAPAALSRLPLHAIRDPVTRPSRHQTAGAARPAIPRARPQPRDHS